MTTSIDNALHLTLVGLGLVLISCVLLVGLLRLLVALTADATTAAPDRPEGDLPKTSPAAREQAAAAAVAVALAMHRARTPTPPRPWSQTSPWQEVMRAAQLRARSRRQ